MALEKLSSNKVFEGELAKYKFKVRLPCPAPVCARIPDSHIFARCVLRFCTRQSEVLGGTDARFNLFVPANAAQGKVPVLVYLSGLTCTEDNA